MTVASAVVESFPRTLTFTVEQYLSGCRVDTFLSKHLRTYTAWRLARLVRAGQARVNGTAAQMKTRVYTGQAVTIGLLEPPDDLMPTDNIPLSIVYEDEWMLVIDKPARLVVHPCGESPRGTLTNAVQWYLDQQPALKGLIRPGVVHRLDRETSGLIVVAKEHLSHRELSIQFQTGRVSKTYVALVDGVIGPDEGVIDAPLGLAPGCSADLMTTRPDALEARPARTLFKVLQRYPQHTLVEAKPRTGRLHQIRVHLASLGHPVIGDEYYGPFHELKPPRPLRLSTGFRPGPPMSQWIDRHALHAQGLCFTHPIHQTWVEFHAPLPTDMQAAITQVSALATL